MAEAAAVSVSSVTVGKTAAADKSVATTALFAPKDDIIVSVKTDGAANNVNVGAKLTYQDGQVAGEQTATLNTSGAETTNVTFKNARAGRPASTAPRSPSMARRPERRRSSRSSKSCRLSPGRAHDGRSREAASFVGRCPLWGLAGYAERTTDRSGDRMLSWIALTLAMGPANLWSYSCDHFLYGACVRVPTGMSVTYEAPVDSGLHLIRHDSKEVALIYEGDAPKSRKHAGSAFNGRRICRVGIRKVGRTFHPVRRLRSARIVGAGSLHIRGSAATADELASLAAVVGDSVSATSSKASAHRR